MREASITAPSGEGMDEARKDGKALRVVFDAVQEVAPQYASNLVVQHDQHDFTITFLDVRSPLLVGPPEEKERQLRETESVRARCLARIIVAASRMPEFVQVMQDNLKTYQDTFATKEKEPVK
jgi:hypothetical protein